MTVARVWLGRKRETRYARSSNVNIARVSGRMRCQPLSLSRLHPGFGSFSACFMGASQPSLRSGFTYAAG
jgi:hypothetical protein